MKAEFNISKVENKIFLAVVGSLTTQTSTSFKDCLQKLFLENSPLQISLQNVSAIDVTGVQLIRSFIMECTIRNIAIDVVPLENGEIIDLLARTGLLESINS